MKRKKLPAQTLKYLLARSGGFCENPDCNKDLFVFFTKKTFVDIEQAAHIIPVGDKGPRSNEKIEGDIDSPDNILLLCPNCHSIIDKAPLEYTRDRLLLWKTEHENKVKTLFSSKYICKNRKEFVSKISEFNSSNSYYYQTYGPTKERESISIDDRKDSWDDYVMSKIIPNNREILQLLKVNKELLKNNEVELIPLYEDHVHSFEINHLTDEKRANVPLFPKELFQSLLGE